MNQKDPLWREEVSIFAADERYVNRRQFAKFLVLTSAGMFAGNLWILIRSWLTGKAVYPINAMGISKAMMEKVALLRMDCGPPKTTRLKTLKPSATSWKSGTTSG